ncbi:MAG TPA: DMT family transporter [Bacteroidota bacterium]|nr:DMT family transporter [Bacteroidota bacterium]
MPYTGELSALLTADFWSFSAVVFASATARAGAIPVNVARLVLAALYLALLLPVLGPGLRLSGAQVGLLAASGVIGLAFGDSFLFKAFGELGPRVTMLIMSTSPAFAACLAWVVLGERLSARGLCGILITLAGVAVVVTGKPAGDHPRPAWRGIWWGVLASVGQGSGLIFAKMAFNEGEINGFMATLVRILASLVVMIPLGVAESKSTGAFGIFRKDPGSFGLTALGALLGPFLGISFSLIAIAHTDVGVAATIMATVPILMLPLVRIMYREHLTPKAVGGAFLAVAGVALLFLR